MQEPIPAPFCHANLQGFFFHFGINAKYRQSYLQSVFFLFSAVNCRAIMTSYHLSETLPVQLKRQGSEHVILGRGVFWGSL